jgi:hypothetical protein
MHGYAILNTLNLAACRTTHLGAGLDGLLLLVVNDLASVGLHLSDIPNGAGLCKKKTVHAHEC